MACETIPCGVELGPQIIEDPVTGEKQVFFGVTICQHSRYAAASAYDFGLQIRTLPKPNSVARLYEIEGIDGEIEGHFWQFETLSEALDVIDEIVELVGITDQDALDEVNALTTWLTQEWVSASVYYSIFGT